MKILCLESKNMCKQTFRSWGNVLKKHENSFVTCNIDRKPVYDAFDETEPDLFIGSVLDITRGVARCLTEYEIPAIFYSPLFQTISAENVECVEELKKDCGQPTLIFNFSHSSSSLDAWKQKGFNTASIMRAMDIIEFPRTEPRTNLKTNVAYFGKHDETLYPYILPLCTFPADFTLKIFGPGNWPVTNHLGVVEIPNLKNVYASSDICLDIKLNDDDEISTTPFNVFSSGGFCLSNDKNVKDVFDIPIFDSPNYLLAIIKNILSYKEKLLRTKKECYENLFYNNHTYLYRMRDLSVLLNMELVNEIN